MQHRYGVRELAQVIGISHATLSRIENGRDVDGKTMMTLISYLFGQETVIENAEDL
jgi:DNA-binding XRE family transcriptional regulator